MKKRFAIVVLGAAVAGAMSGGTPAVSGPSTNYTFEQCAEGWKAVETSSEPTPNSKWHRGNPGDLSTTAFYNGPPYAGGDSETTLTSPVHRWKGGKVKLAYSVNYNYEPEGTRAAEEGIHVEWSRNGRTWRRLAFHGETNAGYPAFERHTINFRAPRGKLILRFRALSDALVQFNGGAVDNVTLPVRKPKTANC